VLILGFKGFALPSITRSSGLPSFDSIFTFCPPSIFPLEIARVIAKLPILPPAF
jgi:hypothetical protein